jgi:hypothetical protein
MTRDFQAEGGTSMKTLSLSAIVLSLVSVYPAPSLAADRFAVQLATPPVWFFRDPSFGVTATCSAVNLHDRQITLTIQLIIHDDDGFPRPILDPVNELKQVVRPGEATDLTVETGNYGFDQRLARCVFKYRGNPNQVKANVILEDSLGHRTMIAPAELARKVLVASPESTDD